MRSRSSSSSKSSPLARRERRHVAVAELQQRLCQRHIAVKCAMHGRACGKYLPVWLSIAAGYDDLGQNGRAHWAALAGDTRRGNASDPLLPRRLRDLNFTRAAEACNVSQPSLTRAIKGLEDELGGPLFRRERNNTHLTGLGEMMRPHLHAGADRDRRRQGARQKLRQARRCRAEARHDVHHRPAPLRAVPAGLPRAPSQGAADRAGRLATAAPGAAGAGRARCRRLRPARGDRRTLPCPPPLRRALRGRRRAGPSLRQAERRARAPTCTTRPTSIACNASSSAMPAASCASRARSCAWSSAPTATTGCRAWRWRAWASPSSPNIAVTMPGLRVRPLIDPEIVRTIQVVTVRGRPHAAGGRRLRARDPGLSLGQRRVAHNSDRGHLARS